MIWILIALVAGQVNPQYHYYPELDITIQVVSQHVSEEFCRLEERNFIQRAKTGPSRILSTKCTALSRENYMP